MGRAASGRLRAHTGASRRRPAAPRSMRDPRFHLSCATWPCALRTQTTACRRASRIGRLPAPRAAAGARSSSHRSSSRTAAHSRRAARSSLHARHGPPRALAQRRARAARHRQKRARVRGPPACAQER
eukprot:1988586-Prymnesium_polylepis.1